MPDSKSHYHQHGGWEETGISTWSGLERITDSISVDDPHLGHFVAITRANLAMDVQGEDEQEKESHGCGVFISPVRQSALIGAHILISIRLRHESI